METLRYQVTFVATIQAVDGQDAEDRILKEMQPKTITIAPTAMRIVGQIQLIQIDENNHPLEPQ